LKTTHDDAADIDIIPNDGYVRARITLVSILKTRLDDTPTAHVFTAWTQPVFATSTPPRT